ncbi:MAG: carbamoyltransferase family protein [Mycobacteriales bacterium]
MAVVLGVNAVFHDPAAALVVDGQVVAAAEEERFTRRKHGHDNVPFAAWELPTQSAAWCLASAGLGPEDLDAVAYSYDPSLCPPYEQVTDHGWEGLRTLYAERAPLFLRTALPGLDPGVVRFVPHHVAHAASAALAAPHRTSSVLVLDGRGETASHLAGRCTDGDLQVLAAQQLPHSLGLLYEDVTEHLGFRRSSDEYKVMALASYGTPRWLPELTELVRTTGDGGFVVEPVDWGAFVKKGSGAGDTVDRDAADLASSLQTRLEQVLLELVGWLHAQTGDTALTMAGGVALNCVANSKIAALGPFEDVWVQPAAGDSGTALGAALHVAHALGDSCAPMGTAALGRGWDDDELEAWLQTARVPYTRPRDIAVEVAECLAADGIVAWFQGRAEYGPRALGQRSLLAHPGFPRNLERMNDVKGREQFRPVAPMVLLDRASEVFGGPLPSPYMLFTHDVHADWRDRVPVVTHVDGSARVQTVDPAEQPLVARMLEAFAARTGLPVVVNTSLNTAGRPIVDDPRDALECFGSGPVDLLALGPFAVRRRE